MHARPMIVHSVLIIHTCLFVFHKLLAIPTYNQNIVDIHTVCISPLFTVYISYLIHNHTVEVLGNIFDAREKHAMLYKRIIHINVQNTEINVTVSSQPTNVYLYQHISRET